MFEQLLSSLGSMEEVDDSDLLFPPGTPFKGVVRSKDFITGTSLASFIGLTNGTPINNNSGWLHFVEDNGYNIYIAKKPLRHGLGWTAINNAQQGKEIIINGTTFVIEFMTGMRTDGLAVAYDTVGGAWNRYIYNLYDGERKAELPATRGIWGYYTERMLGIPLDADGKFVPGSYSFMKDTVSNVAGGHATRGVFYPGTVTPGVMGAWYGGPSDAADHYGWRPMLVEKGTVPPLPDGPFKGEVPQSSLITGVDLAAAVGLTEGAVAFNTTPWLMIVQNGITYYVAKQAHRKNILRETLNTRNLVTGNTTIVIAGKTYKVRLMTGRAANPSGTIGGEWADWMAKLTDGTWANYTTTMLTTGTGGSTNGELAHVQEKNTASTWATNGYPGLLGAWYQNAGTTNNGYGWRPVLELVP